MKTITSILAIGLFGTLLATNSRATLITAPVGGTLIDFSQFNGAFAFTTGPVQVGGLVGENVLWSSTSANSVIGNGGYGLGVNGSWDAGRNGYVGLNNGANISMSFTFANPVTSVGALVNYAPGVFGDAIISVYDSANNLIESVDLNTTAPISTPNAVDAGAFRGFTETTPIARFELSDGVNVADDLQFSRVAVPEPSTFMTGGLLLLAMGWEGVRRFRKQHA